MIFTRKVLFFTLLFLCSFVVKGQVTGNILQINTSDPSGLNVCYNQATISVYLENPSPFTLKNVSFDILMPVGLDYQLASVTRGTEQSVTTPNNPVFFIDSIPTGFDTLTFIIAPNCKIIPFLDQGGVPRIYTRADYTANSILYYDDYLGNPFIVDAPNLSITQITNQTYSGKVGDSYQRCISIINGGTGPLTSFNLTSAHGNGIGITNISIGNWTTVGNTEEIVLNGSHFTTIGDGDNLFETGEVIIICEDVTLLNCSNTLTEYLGYWGCGGDTCQSTFETSNAFFPNTIPNITTTVSAPFNNCFDQASAQELTITNTGPGQAVNVKIDIFQNTSNLNYANSVYSDIDISSVFYIDNIGDTIYPTIDSTYDKHPNPIYSCSSSPKGGFIFRIASLDSGETITVKWDVTNCCKTNCGNKNYHGWRHQITYDNVCGGRYDNGNLNGRQYGYTRTRFLDNGNPATFNTGQTGKFSFSVDDFRVGRMGADTNGLFRFVITKSPCMQFTGGLAFTHLNGTTKWFPDSIFDTGDSLVAYFQGPIPANFNKGTFDFNYVINCGGCAGSSSSGVGLSVFYTPNINCSCELQIACETVIPTAIYCPGGGCPFAITRYSFERHNYGNPDYNEDGIPDALTAAHKDSVEKHKIIYGDTVITITTGKVQTPVFWDYLFAESKLSNSNFISFLSADFLIIDSLGNNHQYNGLTPTITNLPGSEVEIFFDLSVANLSSIGTLPSTYRFNMKDSLTLTIKYFTENNTSGSIQYITNNFMLYVSDTAYPTYSYQKILCNPQLSNIQNINHYTTISGGGAYKINSCDQRLMRKNYYFSVGPCCSNYTGGNLFKKEYRHFSRLKTIGFRIPSGYQIVQSSISERRTAGSNGGVWSPSINITPYYVSNDSVVFKVDTILYADYGGPALLSDEGFYGTLDVYIEPTCAVLPDTTIRVPYWTTQDQLFNVIPRTENRNNAGGTSLTYNYPKLQVQSINPSLVAPNRTVTWTVIIDNLSNISYAPNLWFRKSNISGVNIVSIYDVKNGVYLPNNSNGFFLGDTVYQQENRQFLITADFINCTTDSLRLQLGWRCGGHPDSVTDINCDPLDIKLEVTPLLGALETRLLSQPDTIGLCDTVDYIIEAESIQRGTVYELKFYATLPPGISILNGSSYLSLFDTLNFNLINDPVNVGGNVWRWDLDSNVQYLDTNGLQGILDTTINKVYLHFRVLTDCQFTSGNIFSVGYRGVSPCGRPTNISTIGTKPLYVRDATPAYSTTIKINTTYLTPCLGNTYVEVTVINNGPDTTYGQDSVLVQLPGNINYVNGSFVGVYNPPGSSNNQTSTGTFNYIKWPLSNGINIGDSSVFGFEINANPDLVDCSVFPIRASSESYGGSFCTTTSSFCNINIVVNDTIRNVFTYKGYLNILNDSSYAVFNPPSGEIGYINFDILNTGEQISAGVNTIVNYYFDLDNNGIFSALDVWFANDTINDSIPNLGTIAFNDTINIPSGNSCRIIAVIDTSDNPCSCIPSQIAITIPIVNELKDTIICANSSFQIGIDSINGYTYSWNPTTYLNNPNLSNPIFTYPPSNNNDTLTLVLTTTRVNCSHDDTMQIIVHGEPLALAGPDQNLCHTYNTTLAGNQPQPYWNGLWIPISGPTVPVISDDTLYNSTLSGLVEGTYILTWNMWNDSCPVDIDTLIINVFDSTFASVGPNQDICDIDTAILSGNSPVGTSSGRWTILSGPNSPSFDDDTLFNTIVRGLIEGTYELVWTVSNGVCPPSMDTLIINKFDQPIANAGPDQNLCNTYTTTLAGNQPIGLASGLWTVISGPNTPTLANNTQYNTGFSSLIEGTYMLTWTLSNGNCPPSVDTLLVNVFDPPTANAGPNQDLCDTSATTLAGNIPAGTATGRWSIINGPNVPVFTFDTVYNTTITNLIEGQYKLLWTVSNGNCPPVIDSVLINVYDQPIANAGPDQNICNTYTTTLAGNTPLGSAAGLWAFISGPNTPNFSSVSNPNTALTGLTEGSYRLSWTLSNGNCPPSSDTVVINVYDAPTANAGPDQNLCNQYTTVVSGNNPVGTATGLWTQLSGPNNATFGNPIQSNTTLSNLIEGTYEFIWTVSNGNCPPISDTLQINVYDPPTANAGPNQDLCNQYSTILSGNSPLGTATGLWTQLSGPNSANIIADTAFNTAIINLIEGTYQFIWTVNNGNCPPVSDTVQINVYDPPSANAGPNQNLCNQYSTGLTGNVPMGTATGAWNQISGPNAATISSLTTNTTTISNLIEGQYIFTWTVSNGNCPPVTDTVEINVYDPPTANAGPNQSHCNQYYAIMAGNNPVGTSSGRWTLIAGPNTPTFIDSSVHNTTVVNLIEGTYKFLWTVSNGNCPAAIDSMEITIYNQPVANAGNDQSLCNQYTAILIANTPAGTSTGQWRFDAMSNINVPVIVTPNSEVTSITGLQEGVYRFIWTVNNGVCPPAIDTIQINVYDQPTANAGPDQNLCNQFFTILAGNIPQGTATGKWLLLNGPNVPVFSDSSQYNSAITGLVEGTYQLVWSVANGSCPIATDTVLINVYNQPISNAGPNQELCNQYVTTLAGNNPPGTATGLWGIVNGPNSPTIANTTLFNSPISNLIEGRYTLTWTISNGTCPPDVDTVIINVYDPPYANAGPDQNLCGQTQTFLSANTPTGTATGSWSILNAPNVPNFINRNAANTSIVGLIEGRYELVWTVKNGVCPPVFDTMIINNNPIPVVNFTSNRTAVCENECITFTNLSTINAPDNIDSYYWVFDDGQTSNLTNPTICFSEAGSYGVKLVATSNNGCSDSTFKANFVTIYPLPIANFHIDPQFDVLTFDMIQIRDGSLNSDYYKYYFGNGDSSTYQNPTIFYEDSGTYIITQIVENTQGCKDTFSRPLFIGPEMLIYVPNTFTPDGDDKNEIFIPSIRGVEPETYRFMVFNRWGQLIFETQHTNVGWDGTYKGEMSKTDTYVWKIEAVGSHSGNNQTLIGHVNLLR